MPLQDNPNLANKHRILAITTTFRSEAPSLKKLPSKDRLFNVMRTKSRALINATSEKAQFETGNPEALVAPLKLSVEDVEPSLNMSQVNGLFKDSPVDSPRIPSARVVSPSILKSAALSLSDSSPAQPSELAWSSAIGHASTGKSGRVIERLQGDIDRLHREKQLLKVQYEEIEKANEALVTRNQYLHDRNNNYEHTHETNQRQLERKERQVQDLREELKKEKSRTARAEEQAKVSATNEETWKDQAAQAEIRATQKETEYDAIVACRNLDNTRHQGGLDKVKASFGELLRQREEDLENQKKLEIIAEQQKQTIEQLEDLTRKLSANFKQYRTEIDSAVADLRDSTSGNDIAVNEKLAEMTKVTGLMKWVMNVEREVNHKKVPFTPEQHAQKELDSKAEPSALASPTRKSGRSGTDGKGKHNRKKNN